MKMAKRNRALRKVAAILAVAALALIVTPFQASAIPVLGGTIVAAGGDVKVAFVSSSAAFRSFLQFYSPTTGTLVAGNIYNSDATPAGSIVNLGPFAAGAVLIFSIKVDQNLDGTIDREYFMGDGSGSDSANPANPDLMAHAAVEFGGATFFVGANTARIGFEDLFGGGDFDFNDHVFDFQGVVATTIPNPSVLLLIGLGLVGMAGWSRVRSRRQ